MMLNIVRRLVMCLVLSVFALQANASLIEVSDTLVYDTVTSQYWYSNISAFSGGTGGVDVALKWIPDNYYGLNTWHLASREECSYLVAGTTMDDFMKYFAPTYAGVFDYPNHNYLGVGNYKYWAGGTDSYSLLPDSSWPIALDLFIVRVNYDLNDLEQINPLFMDFLSSDGPQWLGLSEVGAWVTASGSAPGFHEPTPVPEPATILLLGMAMVGLAGIRRHLETR